MFRCLSRLAPAGMAISFPFFNSGPDQIYLTKKFDSKDYDEALKEESGFTRLRNMLKPDEYGNLSCEMTSILQTTLTGAFAGAAYGGLMRGRTAYLNFLERNESEIFKTPLDAKRKLQDSVTMAFSKGAWNLGWRFTIFTFSYCGISTALSVYRGKTSISDYAIAGVTTGALYKANNGIRGVIVGGVVGLGLGLVGGSLTVLLLKVTGKSIEDIRYWQYNIKAYRNKTMRTLEEKSAVELNMPLLDAHDQYLENKLESPEQKKSS